MPDIYSEGEYDVAGFAVGAVERSQLLPRISSIKPGDVIVGLPSSGVHSNGFSLVRKVMNIAGVTYESACPFSDSKKTFGEIMFSFIESSSMNLLFFLILMSYSHLSDKKLLILRP